MRLRYQRRALQQIETVLSYIASHSPSGAAKVEARISAMLARVQQFPESGMKIPIPGVRRINLDPYPYLIDYFVGRDEIVVQRFRHASRKPTGAMTGSRPT